MTQDQLLGLHQDHLILIGEGPHRLTKPTAIAFRALQAAARDEGHNIQIVSSWRSFERQLAIWNSKWRAERPLLDRHSLPVNPDTLSDIERLHTLLHWSALPGTSRHHWGTDLDIYDPDCFPAGAQLQLTPCEYGEQGYFAPLQQWLKSHLAAFDFFWPYSAAQDNTLGVANEPWHISAANTIPVLHRDRLLATLQHSNIEGKSTIIANLDEILSRYVSPFLNNRSTL